MLLTGKIPGFDPPRLVPWTAALALGVLVLSGIAAACILPASRGNGSDRSAAEGVKRQE